MATNNFVLVEGEPTTLTNPNGVLIGDYSSLSGADNDIPLATYVGGKRVSAILELQSTVGTFLVPRMTSTQRNALVTVCNGMMIYNTTINSFQFYENGSWDSGVNSISGTPNEIDVTDTLGTTTISLANNVILPGTGGVTLPTGTIAQRAGGAGTIRFNSQSGVFESTVDGITWATIETSVTGVTSVAGTLNRIAVSPTTGAVVVNIDTAYVGQASLTTVGTLTSGALGSGFTAVAVPQGGTGDTSFTAYSIVCAGTTSTSALQSVSTLGTAGQVLTSNGASALPAWKDSVESNWQDVTTTPINMVSGTSYLADKSTLITFYMPATVAQFAEFEIAGNGTGGWLLQLSAGQVVNSSAGSSFSGGYLSSTNQYDSIKLVCTVANTTFTVLTSEGAITLGLFP